MEPNARASSDVAIVPWAGVVGTEGADEDAGGCEARRGKKGSCSIAAGRKSVFSCTL